MRRSLLPLLVPLLAAPACGPDSEPAEYWITPMDGQTGVGLYEPLRLTGVSGDYPDDYPALPWVTVVDLEDGGFVKGRTVAEASGLLFYPDRPWRVERRYAWTVDDPEVVPHGPEITGYEPLLGSAVFGTGGRLRVLDAGYGGVQQACLVLSDAVSGDVVEPVRVSVDEVDLDLDALEVLPREEWWTEEQAEVPVGVDVVCLPDAVRLDPGARIRVWFSDQGPWLAELVEASPGELVAARLRLLAWTADR